MKTLLSAALLASALSSGAQNKSGYPITPVNFTQVHIDSNTFWGQRLQASREVTIPLAFKKCEETSRYDNFTRAHEQMLTGKTFDIDNRCFSFDDTDPYKTLEGASYLMQVYPNATFKGKRLDTYCDSVIAVIASGQEADGYLNTFRTMNPEKPHNWEGSKRWERVENLSHELYNLGHMAEAAAAHFTATGKKNFLNIATRYADCVCREIGSGPEQISVVPGHQIAEMGLAKLYLATGNRKYLEQARFFLDQRGKKNPSWKQTHEGWLDEKGCYHSISEYSQSHKPVLEQDEAVGHAVRAGYMYAGMADVAALTGDKGYIAAIDRIWQNIVSKKYYITGGVGATSNGEAFGKNYELPNMTAYCETCAAIAQVYLNYRLFLLHGESKYYDVLERTLYNGVLSGISLDGGRFFYPNPLESEGQHDRKAWFGCACCPSNAARFIPSVPGYFYQVKDRKVYVNLYCSNRASLKVSGKKVDISQHTEYPWEGDITVTIDKNAAGNFELCLRIPGWARGEVVPSPLYQYSDQQQLECHVSVNGAPVTSDLQDGYFVISRPWKKGDRVQLHLDMKPRIVTAANEVEADRGRVSVERGPLVYCAEFSDNNFDLSKLIVPKNPAFIAEKTSFRIQAEAGATEVPLTQLSTEAQTLSRNKSGRLTLEDVQLKLIPYYAWNHRGPGRMMVWLPTTPMLSVQNQ